MLVTRGWSDKLDGRPTQSGVANDPDINTFELGKALYFHLSNGKQEMFKLFQANHLDWLWDMKRTPSKGNKGTNTEKLGDFVQPEDGFGYAFRAIVCHLPGNDVPLVAERPGQTVRSLMMGLIRELDKP